jgi:hypothetical protein
MVTTVIHLNPIRAGIVKNIKKLNSYPRCGPSVLMGKIRHPWQHTDYVLGLFGKTVGTARRVYSDFVSKFRNGSNSFGKFKQAKNRCACAVDYLCSIFLIFQSDI